MDFPDLQSHLRFILYSSRGDCLMWKKVVEAISQTEETGDLESLRAVCELLQVALLTGPCEDSSTALKFTVLQARYLMVMDMYNCQTMVNSLRLFSDDQRVKIGKKIARFVMAPASFRRIGPWDTREDRPDIGVSLERSAWLALDSCNWKYLQVLVRYGFWDGSTHNVGDMDGDFEDFFNFCKYAQTQRRSRHIQGMLFGEDRLTALIIWRRLQRSGGRISKDNRRGFRRLPLIVRALNAVTQLQPLRLVAYLRCLRAQFAAAPDPFVSAEEVEEFLLHLFGEDSDRRFVDRLVSQFPIVFGRQTYSPRSLVHQCRSAVRKNFKSDKSSSLPNLVKDLNIPATLKNFILGAPEASSW